MRLPVDAVDAVCPDMLVNVMSSGEFCHCIVPVFPVNDTDVLLPEHIGLIAGVAVPPTDVGFTVTVATAEVAAEHTPLVTIAL